MKSTKLYILGLAIGALATIASSCSHGSDRKEVTNKNYLIKELSIKDVDSFNKKQANRSSEEQKKDTLETVVKIKGYPKGVNSSSEELNFLLEDGSGYGKFCKFYGSESINALLEASIDMKKVTVKPETIVAYCTIDDDSKFLEVKRIEYDNKSFDWSQNIDVSKILENAKYDPSPKEISLDSLINTKVIKNLTSIKTKGYIVGKSSNSELAFVLSDEKGNSVLCYKECTTSDNESADPIKVNQLKTIVDAMNQVPTKVQVTGNFTKDYNGMILLESVILPTAIIGHETNIIAFESQKSNDVKDYIFVSAKEAKELGDYEKVKIIGDVMGVSANPSTFALIKDFNGETIFCKNEKNTSYTQIGDIMLEYSKNMCGKQEIINGKQMYKYIEVSGKLEGGIITMEEIRDVWSQYPILNKEDMSKVIYRAKLDHRINFDEKK